MRMKKYFFITLFSIFLIYSCKSQKTEITIIPNPVFSEVDTFVTSAGNTVIDKNDYFLVKGNIGDKQKLRNMIDSFARSNISKDCKNYSNYLMFFYKESSNVNEKEIQKENPQYRYKIFIYNKDEDYIASFSCWNSMPSKNIDFQPNYRQ